MHRRARRERTLFYRELSAICRWSHRHAFALVLVAAVLCVPAGIQASKIGLDTNLTRLLPENSAAVRWSEQLEPAVGDGGYFSVIFEGGTPEARRRAVDASATRLGRLDGIESVDYRYPTDFIRQYRYTLVPSDILIEIEDEIADWEAEVNPFVDDLGGDPEPSEGNSTSSDLEEILNRYHELPEYHEDPDGRMLGMLIHANQGISNLGGLKGIYDQLGSIVREEAADNEITVSIGGSLRSRVEELDVIVQDVTRMGGIAIVAILLTLAVSFRSVKILPVLVFPLAAALTWAFAFVPWLVGDLNTITSFLLMVLFGMGVDYSIHLVKRFRHELVRSDSKIALCETFTSTGRSVATSGVTTAFGLMILAISDFRGFADFGLIGGTSMIVVTFAMLFVMPATLIVGYRLGLVDPRAPRIPSRHLALPPPWAAALVSALVLGSALASAFLLKFDYDFTNFTANLEELEAIKDKEQEIYPIFFGPAAIYVARDLPALDGALELLLDTKGRPDSNISRISSIRDFAPGEADWRQRLDLIEGIQEMLSGRWVQRVEDPDRRRLIDDVLAFVPPALPATIADLPLSVVDPLMARDGSGLVLALNAAGPPKDGRIAMAFTREIYDLNMPDGILGPTGDKPVLAEILWLVSKEAPLIVVLTFLGIFIIVIIDRRDIQQASWVLVPLVASLLLTFGAIIALGWKLNFFNMVVLPSLLGLGVDHGVHYYRRWRELGRDTQQTQLELFEPVTVATLTTIMGYAGMAFAHHPGLRSIGNLAIVGLTCTWVTALVLLPGLLSWRASHRNGDEPLDD